MPTECPRCKCRTFAEHECGAGVWDAGDPGWDSWSCAQCGLWYSGWLKKWLENVSWWGEELDAEEFVLTARSARGARRDRDP